MRTRMRFTRADQLHRGLPRLLLASLVLQLGLPACADPNQLTDQLTPRAGPERAHGENEAHPHPPHLPAGGFLRVTVEQEGIDAALVLVAPDGKEAVLVDGPGPVYTYGTEDLAAV